MLQPEVVLSAAAALRARIAPFFSAETAAHGWFRPGCPAAGHCAAVSAILLSELAPALPDRVTVTPVSTKVNGESHWFARVVPVGDGPVLDVDITGDQFGRAPAVMVALAGTMYPKTRARSVSELNAETLQRALLLAERADLSAARQDITLLLSRVLTPARV